MRQTCQLQWVPRTRYAVVAAHRPACSLCRWQVPRDACEVTDVCPLAANRPGESGWQRGTQCLALWKAPLAPGATAAPSLMDVGCWPQFTGWEGTHRNVPPVYISLLPLDKPIHPERDPWEVRVPASLLQWHPLHWPPLPPRHPPTPVFFLNLPRVADHRYGGSQPTL